MKTMEKEKLWEAYSKKPTRELREQLIIEYSQLVKLVAGRLSMYLGYNVEYEELVVLSMRSTNLTSKKMSSLRPMRVSG
jgi:DNA-directed RNA polymerase specialized sigma subunit